MPSMSSLQSRSQSHRSLDQRLGKRGPGRIQKKAIFDWLLKNGFISCHFQIPKLKNRDFFWIFNYKKLKMI